jgi:mannose/cellobiose epimerase-like protein (N-acyl-D-glucosamine 2-epimerase family)
MRNLEELRSRARHELFDVVLPFWDRFGIDHEEGGFWCGLDYDGTRVDDSKHPPFQGRGLWVYSHLYLRFGRDPRHLEVARRAKGYLAGHPPGREDPYARYFAAEGLMAYAAASGDDAAREEAKRLLLALFDRLHGPAVRKRPQGVWMMTLHVASQWLGHWDEPWIRDQADAALDAIVNRHYNPDIGLNNEVLRRDFSRPRSEARRCVLGHSIECLWMALREARRRGDEGLASLCCERLRHHLDVAWDPVYGGIAEAVIVGARGWWALGLPGRRDGAPPGRAYSYRKHYWAINEALVAALAAWDHTRAAWAREHFERTLRVADEVFSLARLGLGSHMLVSDRRMRWQPRSRRQDNYHPLRRLMLVLEILDRLLVASAGDGMPC